MSKQIVIHRDDLLDVAIETEARSAPRETLLRVRRAVEDAEDGLGPEFSVVWKEEFVKTFQNLDEAADSRGRNRRPGRERLDGDAAETLDP